MDREDSATRLLVTLYAVESVQASVVGLQGDALVRLYGLRNPDATAYFRARTARSQHDWTLAWAALSRIARTGDPRWSKQEPATGGRSWLSDCLELRWSSYRALLDAVHELTLEASGVKS